MSRNNAGPSSSLDAGTLMVDGVRGPHPREKNVNPTRRSVTIPRNCMFFTARRIIPAKCEMAHLLPILITTFQRLPGVLEFGTRRRINNHSVHASILSSIGALFQDGAYRISRKETREHPCKSLCRPVLVRGVASIEGERGV